MTAPQRPGGGETMSRPRALDLFAGAVGGWSLGLHAAGIETVAACEIDPFRRALYAANFPGVRLYENVRTVTADRIVSDLGYGPDIIVGSPPCQDVSSANTKGRGVEGARTGLFFEALRIVGECRPRWAAFENSPTLRTRGYDQLAEAFEAMGYACWPVVVGADDCGAPHERKRVWIVAFDANASGAVAERWNVPGRWERRAQETASDGSAFYPDADLDAGRLRAPTADDDGRRAARQRSTEDPRDADRAGPSERESLGSDARAQFEALERAIGGVVHTWNGGAARHLRMGHEFAARLVGIRVPDSKHPGATVNAAKAIISAQGDAILPMIATAIGRAILRTEAALALATGRAALRALGHGEGP